MSFGGGGGLLWRAHPQTNRTVFWDLDYMCLGALPEDQFDGKQPSFSGRYPPRPNLLGRLYSRNALADLRGAGCCCSLGSPVKPVLDGFGRFCVSNKKDPAFCLHNFHWRQGLEDMGLAELQPRAGQVLEVTTVFHVARFVCLGRAFQNGATVFLLVSLQPAPVAQWCPFFSFLLGEGSL